MLLICEQCKKGIEIPSRHPCEVSCTCGAKYSVDPEKLTYDRVITQTGSQP